MLSNDWLLEPRYDKKRGSRLDIMSYHTAIHVEDLAGFSGIFAAFLVSRCPHICTHPRHH